MWYFAGNWLGSSEILKVARYSLSCWQHYIKCFSAHMRCVDFFRDVIVQMRSEATEGLSRSLSWEASLWVSHVLCVCVGVCLCVSCTFRWSGLLLLWGCHSGFSRWTMMCFCSSDSVMELLRPTLTPLLRDLKLRPRCVCVRGLRSYSEYHLSSTPMH